MTDSPDIIDLLQSAGNGERNPEYDFQLKGDLNQMAEQKKALLLWGFDIQQNDVYPSLKKTDVKKALELIWGFRIEGWWHYHEKYVELGICTNKEFFNYVLEKAHKLVF